MPVPRADQGSRILPRYHRYCNDHTPESRFHQGGFVRQLRHCGDIGHLHHWRVPFPEGHDKGRFDILPSLKERDSIGFKKPRAVLPHGLLQIPAADRLCGSLDRPTPSVRRLIHSSLHLHQHWLHTHTLNI